MHGLVWEQFHVQLLQMEQYQVGFMDVAKHKETNKMFFMQYFKERKEKKAKKEAEEKAKKDIIAKQIESLEELASELSHAKNSEGWRSTDNFNSNCPRCKTEKSVEKFRRVKGEGSGSVNGDFIFGCGSISGRNSTTIDTFVINSCPSCGHEWKKREHEYINQSDYIKEQLRWIHYYLEKNEVNSTNGLWVEAKTFFSNVNAETIIAIGMNKLSEYDLKWFLQYVTIDKLIDAGFKQ